MDKKAWRDKIISLQKNLSEKEWKELSKAIFQSVIHYECWKKSTSVALFYSVKKEVDTLSLIQRGWSEGKSIYLPKCFPQEKEMKFYKLESFDQLEIVYYGIAEPIIDKCEALSLEELELILVPGLAFDRRGYRIGYGGGYYDRFLKNTPSHVKKLSLAFSFQVSNDQNLPRNEYDIPVETIITNEEIMICTNIKGN